MDAKVFISHSSADDKVASAICTALENRGLGCWIAGRDVGPGENFQEAIVRAIRASRVMVLVFTENANNSHDIKKELVLAGQSNLVIIPARVENVAPNDAFAYEFATRQWIDLFKDWEREIERLSAWIAGILSIEPVAAAQRPTMTVASAAVPALAEPHSEARATTASTPFFGNPLLHFVGAFLIVIGVYVLIYFVSSFAELIQAPDHCRGDYLDCLMNGPDPKNATVTPSAPGAAFRLTVGLFLFSAMIAAGLGAVRQRNWARFLGFGLCGVGLLIAAYLTFDRAAVALGELLPPDPSLQGPDPSLQGMRYSDGRVVNSADPRSLARFAAIFSCLFAIAFAGAGVAYIWGWQSRLAPNPNEPRKAKLVALAHRGSAFGTFVIALCALAAGAFYVYRLTLDDAGLLWLAALIALDALVFTYCYIRFHKEFDSTGAAKVVPVQS